MKHKDLAIKNNCIGIIQFWNFDQSFSFHNFEKGVIEPIKDASEVQIITREEFNKLYDERNIKEGTEREKQYGKIWEAHLKLGGKGSTDKSGMWSKDFARELGEMFSLVFCFKKMCALYEERDFETLSKKPSYKAIALENFIGPDSLSWKVSTKVFDETIEEKEILDMIGEFKSLPPDWIELTTKREKLSPETKHYFALATPIPIHLEKISEDEHEKILDAENAFLKNVKEEKLKFETRGHVPYGSVYHTIENKLELHEKYASSDDAKVAVKMIGKTISTDSQCYLCGKRMGFNIKDENTLEFFGWEYPEGFGGDKIISNEACELGDKKLQTHSFELTFPTGKVMIDNYFVEEIDGEREYLFDVPEDEKYDEKYTLQTLKGRFNRQDYIAKTHNAGYAQMGNMSVDVYISKDKKKIIIGGEPWDEETAADKKFNEKFEAEYKKIGHISLSVWRWECADKQVLLDRGHSGEADVEAKVVPGTYVVTHHYDNTGFKERSGRYQVYSEIELKK